MNRSVAFRETVEHYGKTLVVSAVRGRAKHACWVSGDCGRREFEVERSRHYPFGPALRNRLIELYCGAKS